VTGDTAKRTLHGYLRESGEAMVWKLDGAAGMRSDNSNIAEHDAAWWDALRDRIERTARAARS